jgi:hypothetical protein
MRIKVQYQNETTGEIEAYQLDDLILSNKIKKFFRSGEWVVIGKDPIRGAREDYPEFTEARNIRKKQQTKK